VATLVAAVQDCVIGWHIVRDHDYPQSNATYTIWEPWRSPCGRCTRRGN
jgi:hypothetical protein